MNKKLLVGLLGFVIIAGYQRYPVSFAESDEYFTERSAYIEMELDKGIEAAHKAEAKQKKEQAAVPAAAEEKIFAPTRITKKILPAGKRDKTITLDFDNATLSDVLKTIGTSADINISLDPALKDKKVDFHLKNVSLEDALRMLYSAYGLSSSLIGSSLYVSTKEKIKQENIETRLIKLQNLNVEEAKALIQNLVEVTNVSKEINSLMVMGGADEIAEVEEILKRADQPQPLVVLETKILEVNKDGLRQLGINWSDSLTLNFQESVLPATLPATAVAGKNSPFKLYKISRNAVQFETVLWMLENQNKAKVLSNPRITTLNNKTSEIFVGDRIPYTVTVISGGISTTEVRFTEPGIRLKITPSIIDKDFVVIKIQPEVSYIYTFKGPNDEYPWVKTREATAYVRVKAGETFVLGGLLTSDFKKNTYKVPIVGDVPLMGELFKYNKFTYTDSELIITVTPMILTGTEALN